MESKIRARIAELEQYAERLRIEFERIQGALGELRALLQQQDGGEEDDEESG